MHVSSPFSVVFGVFSCCTAQHSRLPTWHYKNTNFTVSRKERGRIVNLDAIVLSLDPWMVSTFSIDAKFCQFDNGPNDGYSASRKGDNEAW